MAKQLSGSFWVRIAVATGRHQATFTLAAVDPNDFDLWENESVWIIVIAL